jgi:TetR/AcrR family transcriptional repressor of nem operon
MTQHIPKKEKLLVSARHLMLEKGYVATTVDQICEDASVTKGSFFHYFKSKDDVGKEVVTRFASDMNNAMQSCLKVDGNDPLDLVYGYVDAAIMATETPESRGCLVGMFTQELSKSHPDIRAICEHAFDQMIESLTGYLQAAKDKYAPEKTIDVKSLAESFIALSQGAMILTKAKEDRTVMRRTLSHYKEYLAALFGR